VRGINQRELELGGLHRALWGEDHHHQKWRAGSGGSCVDALASRGRRGGTAGGVDGASRGESSAEVAEVEAIGGSGGDDVGASRGESIID
jgi:hypothetical protein